MMTRLAHATIVYFMCAATSAFGQLIIAHRGASHDAPENTLSAFRLAMEQGADGFEADFYLTSDGRVIAFHDKDTKRIAGEKFVVAETPFEKLRALDVGSWKDAKWKGEQMPTMEEVLAVVPEGKKIFIELKSGAEIVEPMARIIEDSNLSSDQITIISFNEDAVAASKKRLPHLKVYWLCGFKKKKGAKAPPAADEVIATLKRTGADALDAEAVPKRVNEAFGKRFRAAGYDELHVWTVDDPKLARYYRNLGVTSITTNRHAWLREQLEATTPE